MKFHMVPVKDILGAGCIPKHRTSADKWLKRNGIHFSKMSVNGGAAHFISLSDLPAPERQAYLERRSELHGLPGGQYDDAKHKAFLSLPPAMRNEATRKAEIAAYLLSIPNGATWPDRVTLVQRKFGSKGTSKLSLKRLLKAIEWVDPVNFAPALVAGYRTGQAPLDQSDEAWRLFLSILQDSYEAFPIRQAWRDVRDVARVKGWDWPSYVTVHRRWTKLPAIQRDAIRRGRDAALKAGTQPVLRNKTTIAPMEIVSLDGRTLDFWADMGDGKSVRLTMLALVDVASNYVLGYELAESENAVDTVRLIRKTCERYGIFQTLYTDNGSAFAGHLVAGGTGKGFRKGNRAVDEIKSMGVCRLLGISLKFAMPGNAKAKIAERAFATLSRVIDDRPEFKGAHAGHNAGAAPDSKVVPIPLDRVKAVIDREINRHNNESGRKSQGAHGRSYAEIFQAGHAARVNTYPTERQLWLASLVYKIASVDRNGQIKVDHWVYGGPATQMQLTRYHEQGQKVLFGRDPDDLSRDGIAFTLEGYIICEGIEHVARGAYDSVKGIVTAKRNRKAAERALEHGQNLTELLNADELAAHLSAIPDPTPPDAQQPRNRVTGGHFNSPLTNRTQAQTAEPDLSRFHKNMDRTLNELKRSGNKLA